MSIFTNDIINSGIAGAKSIGIAGHIRPDGDCIGSCLALYQYLKQNKDLGFEQIDLYLEPFGNEFRVLKGVDEIKHSFETDVIYDVFISLDCGSLDRLGAAQKYYLTAKKTINIDHHISNTSFGQINYVVADASSTCEVLFGIFDEKQISLDIAEDLYVGLVHDTGVFKHSNTTEKTMLAAGRLISKGVKFSKLIDETFYLKTFVQNQILGRCLMESTLLLGGRVVVASITRKEMDFYQAKASDTDGIIDQLRVTKGTEVAVFLYEMDSLEYKVSMRSNGDVNVSKIAVYFGGGGHIKAAGCTMQGTLQDIIQRLMPHIETQLKELGK